jgi:hypothetical protein
MLASDNLNRKLVVSLVVVSEIDGLPSGDILDVDQGLISVVVGMNSECSNI